MNEVQNTEQPVSPVVDEQPEPKLMHQHEINALLGAAKKKGYEKAKVELMAQMANPAVQTQTPDTMPSQSSISAADNEAKLRQIAIEELSKQREEEQKRWLAQAQQEAGTRILNELNSKVAAAKGKFEDYDKVVKQNFENFAKTPEVLMAANQFDNAGEMLYDLAKNPGKIVQLAVMDKIGMKEEAFAEMKRLSESIKKNEISASQPQPKMPLSQVTPSNVGVGKIDGNVSSNDFRGSY